MKITRSHKDTEARLRDAFAAKTTSVEPADGWATIVDRLDRRPPAWTWITHHPLALGAGAVVIALLVVLGISLLGGDEQAQDLDVVDDPPVDTEGDTLVAVTTDGRLVELPLAGEELREVADLTGYVAARDPFLMVGGVQVAGEGAFFAGTATPDEACPASEQIVTDLWRYPLDLEPGVTLDLGQFAAAAGVFAVSPDGTKIAYVGAEDGDRCAPARMVTVVELESDEVVGGWALGSIVARDLVWVGEDRLAVIDGSGSAPLPTATPLGVYVVDIGASEDWTEVPGVGLPLDAVIKGVEPGRQLIATTTAGHPFEIGDEVEGDDQPIEVWRANLDLQQAELVATIDAAAWSCPGPAECEGQSFAAVGLTPLSMTEAPDGSVYVTVVRTAGVTAGDAGVGVEDPADARLFRIDLDGTVEWVADGVLAVDVKPATGDEPEPDTSAAGPVVGARADGSVVLLDPATGEVAEELWADADFAGPGQASDGVGAPGTELLGEMAVVPDQGRVLQTRPSPVTNPCEEQIAADWDVWGFATDTTREGGGPAPLFDPDGGPPSRMPTVSPDGSQLAYLTTSNGARCDTAFVVTVVERTAPESVIATHTLPVGVLPLAMAWPADDQLVIGLTGGNDADFPDVLPVVVDPAVSGPVDFSSVEGGLPYPLAYTTGGPGHHAYAFPGPDGTIAVIRAPLTAWDEPEWTFDLPVSTAEGAALAMSVDGAGTAWVTVAVGEIEFPVAPTNDVRTYRWSPEDPEAEPAQVSDELVGVAASPFSTGAEPPPAEPEGGTTTTAEDTTTTTAAAPDADFYTVTAAGQLVRNTLAGERTVVAELPLRAPAAAGVLHENGHQLAVTPDGRTAYVALRDPSPDGICADGWIVAVDLTTGVVSDLGAGHTPAVSPDGRFLALGANSQDADGCREQLRVVSLGTSDDATTSTTWQSSYPTPASGSTEVPLISRIVWAPDSIGLAYEVGFEDGSSVFPLDLAAWAPGGTNALTIDSGQSLLGLGDEVPDRGLGWQLGGYDATGITLVAPCVTDCPSATVAMVEPDGALVSSREVDLDLADAVLGTDGWLASDPFCLTALGSGSPCPAGGPLRTMPPDGSTLTDLAAAGTDVVAVAWLP
jgi:hypothetical protein